MSATETYKSGPLRRDAPEDARRLRRGDGDHAALARRGAAADLFAVPADLARRPARCCRCRSSSGSVDAGTIVFRDPDNGDKLTEVPVTGGHVKCQWKADWALRWAALGVDYEMSGKDLIDSVKLSSRICAVARRRAAGGLQLRALPRRERPEDLEVEGQRPDHRGVADLRLAGEPVAVTCSSKPRAAKKLYFDVIPKAVDEYFTFLDAYPGAGRGPEARQSGLAHPFRPAADDRHAGHLRACSSISPARRTPTTRPCCGASSSATSRA